MEHSTSTISREYGSRVVTDDVRKIGMWIFLSSEVIFFTALILGALFYRNETGGGERLTEVFDMTLITINTFILLMSSVTMVSALAAADDNNPSRLRLWLTLTLVGGAIFLGGQVYEFYHLAQDGHTLRSSMAWGSFFTLTGFHGAHVFIGALLVGSQLIRALRTTEVRRLRVPVEIVGLYWHFVDLVWIVIFTVVYLIE